MNMKTRTDIIKMALEMKKGLTIQHLCELASFVEDPPKGDGSATEDAEKIIINKFIELDPIPSFKDAILLAESFSVKTGTHRMILAWMEKNGMASKDEVIAWAKIVQPVKHFLAPEAEAAIIKAAKNIGVEIVDGIRAFVDVQTCMCPKHQIERLDIDKKEKAALIAEMNAFMESPETLLRSRDLEEQLKELGLSAILIDVFKKTIDDGEESSDIDDIGRIIIEQITGGFGGPGMMGVGRIVIKR